MLIELAIAAALSVQSQDRQPYEGWTMNSSTYAVGRLPWLRGEGPQIDYPQPAHDAGISGEATVECAVSRDTGVIGDCRVVDETPAGYGFGRMVRAGVSRRYLDLTRWTEDTVRIRVEFSMEGG